MKDDCKIYVLFGSLFVAVLILGIAANWGHPGKPQIKYIDVPVPSEPAMCPVPAEPSAPICMPDPKPDSVWPEPSDMPTPWKIIPKPGLPKVKTAKPHLSKRRIAKPFEYIDANGTRFYPMRNWPY